MMSIVNILVGLGLVGLAVTVRVQKQIMKIQQQAFEGLEEIIVNQQATINEKERMIQLQKDIIDEASNGICELICFEAGYADEGETLGSLIDRELSSVWTKMIITYDSTTVEEYDIKLMNHLREQKELMEEYDTIAKPKRQCKVVSLDEHRR